MEPSSLERWLSPRILVIGCGGIGGVILGSLLGQGRRVSAVAHRPEIARALKAGVRLRTGGEERVVRGELEVHVEMPSEGTWELILLTVQPPQLEAAARAAAERLSPDGALVVFQNGLCEERAARIVGASRVMGAVVAWGASMREPGSYDRTSSGGFSLGMLDGSVDERLRSLGRLLEAVGPVDITSNLVGARWSKLAINCAVSSLGTLGGQTLGAVMMHRLARRLALEVMTETVEVARAAKIRLEKVSGTLDLEWLALTGEEKRAVGSPSLVVKHGALLAVGARYRRLRSSMLSAIERGREPAVDFLNGEVVEHGRALQVPTPVNARIQTLVHELARKHISPGLGTLRALYEETRTAGTR
jgi:2-dehydropantoate 2-reductase